MAEPKFIEEVLENGTILTTRVDALDDGPKRLPSNPLPLPDGPLPVRKGRSARQLSAPKE